MLKSMKAGVLAMFACIAVACAPLAAITSASTAITSVSDLIVKVAPTVKIVGDKVTVEGTRGLILAHNAYQGAANGLAPFVRAKRFDAATVDKIEKLNERAIYLFEKADTGLSLAQRTAGILAIADEFARLRGQ